MAAFGRAYAAQAVLLLQLFDIPLYGSFCYTDQ